MDHQTTYDTLLSHNSRDKRAIEQLAVRLRDEGLEVWFDEWNLVPGEPWQSAIERALATSRSVAVFIGGDGIGPWHELELRVALNRQVREGRGFRVIPVLLPEATVAPSAHLPAFLEQLTQKHRGRGRRADAFDVPQLEGQRLAEHAAGELVRIPRAQPANPAHVEMGTPS